MNYKQQYENAIIIAPSSYKKELLKYRNEYPRASFKVMSLEEAKNYFLYQYDDRAVVELLEQGHGFNEALDMLKAFAYFKKEKQYQSEKLKSLYPIFLDLENKGYLFKFPNPEKIFQGKNILVMGYKNIVELTELWKDVLNMSVSYESEDLSPVYPNVYEFADIYGEVHYLCNRICALIKDGVKPDDIYIYNADESYIGALRFASGLYGFGIDLGSDSSLLDLPAAKKFLELVKTKPFEDALNEVSIKYGDKDGFDAFSVAVQRYFISSLSLEDQINVFESVLSKVKKEKMVISNAINATVDPYFPPSAHIFYLNFANKTAPRIYSDNEFLKDAEKIELGMDTSISRSATAKEEAKVLLKNPHLESVSYKKIFGTNEYFKSPLVKELGLEVTTPEIDREFSKKAAVLWSVASDDAWKKILAKNKFGPVLKKLAKEEGLKDYDPSFAPFEQCQNKDKEIIYSYSSLNGFFECPFHYYLDKVLRINDDTSNFSGVIGTIFHYVLCQKSKVKVFSFDAAWDEAIADAAKKWDFTSMDKVLLIRLKRMCQKVVEYNECEEMGGTNLVTTPEKTYYVDIDDKTKLKAIIDKSIVSGAAGENVTIVDYKTSSAKFLEDMVPYGLSLQLPIYSFVLKNTPDFAEKKTLGLFIENILPGWKDENYEKIYALNGLFCDDLEIIKTLTADAKYIRGVKFDPKKFDGGRSQDYFNDLADLAREKVLEANVAIRGGNFEIAPKFGKDVDACKYCPYRDICYVKATSRVIIGDKDDIESIEEDE